MLQTFRNAWKIEDIRKKILFTLFMILMYRVGNAIPVPYVNVTLLGQYFTQLESTTPPEAVGEVLGDLNMRRGTVLDMAPRDDMQVVHARVPMAQMFGYATAIRSLTKGRASYSMEPSDFELVSKSVHDHLLSL